VNIGSGSRASELFDEILKLFKILKSKLARHIQKPVEIVILQNLSVVFDFFPVCKTRKLLEKRSNT
jgi:hypothetical protein